MRVDVDSFREIFDTLTRNRSRTLLTGFGVFWGLFMLLFMLGGGDGVKALLMKNFEGFASNTTIIVPSTTGKPYKGLKEERSWNLTMTDVERMKQMVPELDVVTPVLAVWGGKAVYSANTSDCSVKGVKEDYSKVESPKIKYGRYINSVDVNFERKVCVIGKRIYNDLFPGGEDPCGEFIKVGAIYYQVIGVDFSAGNMSINGSADQSVVIPITVAQKIFHRGNNVDLLCMTGKGSIKVSSIEQNIRQIVAREHSFDPTDEQALEVVNTEELFTYMDDLMSGISMLIWLVGLGTLLAGAIGVSNIMIVTVKERTVEIGIRRAIGATPKMILSQVMAESITLTLLAGMLSIVFTVLILSTLDLIMKSQGVSFQISFGLAVAAAALLAFLGALAGLAPARRAMSIKPVDAMRDE